TGKFAIVVDKNVKSKTVKINIELNYYGDTELTKDNNNNDVYKDPSAMTQYTQYETVYLRVDNEQPSNPIVEITKLDTLPLGYIEPGNDFTVGFEIYNPGDAPAKNLKLKLTGEGMKADGINMKSGLSTQDITELRAKSSEYVFFELTVPKNAQGGTYPLSLEYEFGSQEGQTAPPKGEYGFSVEVKKLAFQPSTLIFDRISFPAKAIGRNRDAKISFTLKNVGTSEAKNIVISALSKDESGLTSRSASQANVESLAPGQTAEYSFDFRSTVGAQTQNYPVDIKVQYVDDSTSPDKPHEIMQTVGVFVVAPKESAPGEKGPTSTPKLIIETYEIEPKLVQAGQNFDIKLTLFNTNETKTIKNIKLYLTSEPGESTDKTKPVTGAVFTPVNSSNTFYIDSIAPRGKVEKQITMSTVPDTEAKTYTITANFEYEDKSAEKYTATELIGVPVIQKAKLDLDEPTTAGPYFTGQPSYVDMSFYNTGKVTLYNVKVKLESDDLTTESSSYYKGNFNPGTSDSVSMDVTAMEPGEKKGKFVITYEDNTGEVKTEEKEFTLNFEEMQMPDMDGEDFDYGPMTKPFYKKPIFWIALLVPAAIILIVVLKKRKKKKEEQELSIDEDN
ncbi:MAG: hypothetical protein Q4P29_03130, partial [Tissierellia bacterium]|nr:hypothetical protein [Tissierellia bacterium]